MTPQKAVTIGFATIAAVAIILMFYFAVEYHDERALKEAYQAEVVQNDSAYQNQLNQVLSDKQNLAVRITNLNATVSKKDAEAGYWKVAASTYKIQLDSVKRQGSGVASSGVDSVGEYAQVDFSGKESIASFTGFTRYYLKPPNTKPWWKLDIVFDEFPLYSELVQGVDKIWRTSAYTDTPGIMFFAFHEVDSSIYIEYKSKMVKPVQEEPVAYGLRLKANIATVKENINNANFSSSNIQGIGVDASAELYYDYWNVTYYPLTRVLSAGVIVDLNLSKLLRKIF